MVPGGPSCCLGWVPCARRPPALPSVPRPGSRELPRPESPFASCHLHNATAPATWTWVTAVGTPVGPNVLPPYPGRRATSGGGGAFPRRTGAQAPRTEEGQAWSILPGHWREGPSGTGRLWGPWTPAHRSPRRQGPPSLFAWPRIAEVRGHVLHAEKGRPHGKRGLSLTPGNLEFHWPRDSASQQPGRRPRPPAVSAARSPGPARGVSRVAAEQGQSRRAASGRRPC